MDAIPSVLENRQDAKVLFVGDGEMHSIPKVAGS